MISLITIKNQEDVRDFLNEIVESLNIENKLFLSFADDPHVLLIILAVFSAIYLISCVLIIVGSLMVGLKLKQIDLKCIKSMFISNFQCKYKMLYPFLVVDMIYIIFMLVLTVMLLINFKKRGFGMGALIVASNLSALGLSKLIKKYANQKIDK